MPRNGSGTYTLPAGNPVEAGTLIEATWANNTLNDIANEMTDSLSRSGEGGMLAPFRLADGLQATPGIAWLNEPSTGFYRAGSQEMWGVVGGTQVLQYTANGVAGRFTAGSVTTPSITRLGDLNTGIYFPGADEFAIATGGVARMTFDSAGAVAIPGTLSVTGDVTVDTNTLFVDAANNRVGVGTVSPTVKLDVAGGISIGNADNLTWGGAYGATTPAIAGSAGFLAFYPNGSTSGEQMRLTATSLGLGTASPTFGTGTGIEIERAGIATLRLENSSASNSFELYVDTAGNGVNLRGRDSSPMNFWTGNTSRMTLGTSGGLTLTPAVGGAAIFNEDGVDADLRVEGDTDVNLVFVDASTDRVGIGTNAPAYKIDVNGTARATTLVGTRTDPRVVSAASASSLTPDISVADQYAYTALAATLAINAPIGTPVDGNKLLFRILDNGVSRTLNWNGTYTPIGVTLPTATTAGKMVYVGCIYNAANTRWDVVGVTTQA